MPGSYKVSDCRCNEGFRADKVGNCSLIPPQETAGTFQKIVSFETDIEMDSLDPDTKEKIENRTSLELDVNPSRVTLLTSQESFISSRRRLLEIFRAQFAIASVTQLENDIMNKRIKTVLSEIKINVILSEAMQRNVIVNNLEISTIVPKSITKIIKTEDNTTVIVLGIISGILSIIVCICIIIWCAQKQGMFGPSAFEVLPHDYCEVCSNIKNTKNIGFH